MRLWGGGTGPAHLKLVAAVTEVSGNCQRINHVIVGNFGGRLRLSVLKQDVLDAVESKQGGTQTLTGHHIPVFSVKGGEHFRAVHQRVEGILVKGPGVDVRVDAEIAGGSEEEGLALFPPFACLQKNLACHADIGVSLRGLQCPDSFY